MTAALRKIDSPQPRRTRQRVAAKNSHNKVTYLPYASPAEVSSPPNRVDHVSVSTKPSSANSALQRSRKSESLNGKAANFTNPWTQPMWLRSLKGINTATAIATFILVSAVLGLYSQVVYTKQNWGREYRKLEQLQKEERQITVFNEALKHDIAQTAKQEGTGLVTPDGNYMIVLEPTPVSPLPENSSAQRSTFQPKQPLGY